MLFFSKNLFEMGVHHINWVALFRILFHILQKSVD